MKKEYVLGLCMMAVLSYGSNAFGSLTVTLSQNAYSSGSGGEFNAVTTGASYLGDYSPSAVVGSGFETFCIDTSHNWYGGVTYNYTLGSTTTATSGNQISSGTCYLYSQFAAGTLTGYNYGAGRLTTAGELQNTLWALEGEISSTGIFVSSNPFYNDLIAAFGTIASAEANAGANNYGVQVMELSTAAGSVGQSQLVEIQALQSHEASSVPEPSTVVAGVLLLVPLGVAIFRQPRRQVQAIR